MDEKHRDPGSVLRRVAHLFDFEALTVDRDGLRGPDGLLAGHDVVAVDGRRGCEGDEGEDSLRLAPFSAQTGQRPDRRKRNLALGLPVGVEDPNLRDDVLQVPHEEPAADRGEAGDRNFPLADALLPVLPPGVLQVHREDAAVRSLPIGLQKEPIAGDRGGEPRLDIVDDRLDRAAAGEVAKIELGFHRSRAVGNDDLQVAAVLGKADVDALAWPVTVPEDFFVFAAVAADRVKIDARSFLLLPCEVEALAVLRDGNARIAGPRQSVRKFPSGVHVEKLHDDFVFAPLPDAVTDEASIVSDAEQGDRGRMIRAQGSRVEQGFVLPSGALADIENRKVLVGGALVEEVTAAARCGRGDRGDLQEFDEPLLNRIPTGQRVQGRLGVLVLRVDPGTCLGRGLVLEPTVGIVDGDAAVRVDDVFGLRGRRLARGTLGGPNREGETQERDQGEGDAKRQAKAHGKLSCQDWWRYVGSGGPAGVLNAFISLSETSRSFSMILPSTPSTARCTRRHTERIEQSVMCVQSLSTPV